MPTDFCLACSGVGRIPGMGDNDDETCRACHGTGRRSPSAATRKDD